MAYVAPVRRVTGKQLGQRLLGSIVPMTPSDAPVAQSPPSDPGSIAPVTPSDAPVAQSPQPVPDSNSSSNPDTSSNENSPTSAEEVVETYPNGSSELEEVAVKSFKQQEKEVKDKLAQEKLATEQRRLELKQEQNRVLGFTAMQKRVYRQKVEPSLHT